MVAFSVITQVAAAMSLHGFTPEISSKFRQVFHVLALLYSLGVTVTEQGQSRVHLIPWVR